MSQLKFSHIADSMWLDSVKWDATITLGRNEQQWMWFVHLQVQGHLWTI